MNIKYNNNASGRLYFQVGILKCLQLRSDTSAHVFISNGFMLFIFFVCSSAILSLSHPSRIESWNYCKIVQIKMTRVHCKQFGCFKHSMNNNVKCRCRLTRNLFGVAHRFFFGSIVFQQPFYLVPYKIRDNNVIILRCMLCTIFMQCIIRPFTVQNSS